VVELDVEVVDVETVLGLLVVEAVTPVAAEEAVVVAFDVEEAVPEVVLCVPTSVTEPVGLLPISFPSEASKSSQLMYVTPGHTAVHSYVDLYASVLLTFAGKNVWLQFLAQSYAEQGTLSGSPTP